MTINCNIGQQQIKFLKIFVLIVPITVNFPSWHILKRDFNLTQGDHKHFVGDST